MDACWCNRPGCVPSALVCDLLSLLSTGKGEGTVSCHYTLEGPQVLQAVLTVRGIGESVTFAQGHFPAQVESCSPAGLRCQRKDIEAGRVARKLGGECWKGGTQENRSPAIYYSTKSLGWPLNLIAQERP